MSSVSSVNSLLSSTSTTGTTGTNISSILAAVAGVSTPGIDVDSAVTAALYADRANERVWQNEQTTLTSQTTALTTIQTATEALSNDFTSLNSLTGPLSTRTVTSSDPYAVTASAAAGTTGGTHTITVESLATTASWYSDQEPSATTALPSANFTIATTAGASATISVGSGGIDTLSDLATNINSQNLGVTASVITDSTGSRLAIVSNASGTAADFSVTSNPVSETSWTSASLTSNETLGANSFTITQSGVTSTITTTSGETLSQLADNINGQSLGVTASVVSDSIGSHLSIVSTDGATPFTVSEPSFGFSQAAAGADASLTVDGTPVTSATNTVTGALAGVTLTLVSATGSSTPVNLTVGSDTSSISTALNQFVSDYNSAINLVNTQFSYSASTSSEGVLSSDPTVRQLQQTLQQLVSYVASPASGSTSTTVSTLSDLGITENSDGTLALDSGTLTSALSNNASDVSNFFLGSALNGFASSVASQLNTFVEPSTGAFTVDLNSISTNNNDLSTEISDYETNYIANQKTLLTAMYSQAEAALQELPTQMAQINAELGNNSNSNSNG